MKNNLSQLNFAVGPVMMTDDIRAIGANQIPYFRTADFSKTMLECEQLFKQAINASSSSRAIFITGSGTASMEAAIINTLTPQDKALIIDGGSFGHRFCEICAVHGIPFTPISCQMGKTLTETQLEPYENAGYTAFIVNLCETSTGVLYDLNLISRFCAKNNLFLIIDAVSAFLCDPLNMEASGADIIITGSQKALALAPGISIICLSERALERVKNTNCKSYYFDIKSYLRDGERGQTPFTPAVSVLLQLHARLKNIEKAGGAKAEIESTAQKASYFREHISNLPVDFFADKKSNSVTSLTLTNPKQSAYRLFEILMQEYNIWICPNGGSLKERVFRVGHMGALANQDYDRLIFSIKDVFSKGKL